MEAALHEIAQKAHQYIYELNGCTDDQVFNASTLTELGKYYFQKALQNVEGLTDALLKLLIKSVALHNNEPQIKDEYYDAVCKMAFIHHLPKSLLTEVQNEFDDIFNISYNRVKGEIAFALSEIDQKIENTKQQSLRIKSTAESVCGGSFIKDITADYASIKELAFKLRSLETDKETIEKVSQMTDDYFRDYCDMDDPISVEQALRKTTLSLASHHDSSPIDAKFTFSSYRIWIEATEDSVLRPYALFYKIKFLPITYRFEEQYRMASYIDEENAGKELKAKYGALPKIDDLYHMKQNDSDTYSLQLQEIINSYHIIDDICAILDSSTSLYGRKVVLEKTLNLYRSGELELFVNVAPVQIEGIITDYLYDETTFRRFTDLQIYPKAVLREKLILLGQLGNHLPSEAMLYFYFSFNNIVRNNIAHGVFENFCRDTRQIEIFSAELLMDMYYIIHIININSETEKMRRFIHGYIEHYKRIIKSEEYPHFGALLNDLIGNKTISSHGLIEKYRPLQVLYWILNPTYQKIYETVERNNDLMNLRNDLLSKEFWEYVLASLKDVVNAGYDYLNIHQEFDSIIRGLFTCGVSSDVKVVLGKVNAELVKIRELN